MGGQSDALDLINLVMRLEDAGLQLTDEQLRVIDPYYVSPQSVSVEIESSMEFVYVLAKSGVKGLAIFESGPWIVVDVVNSKRLTNGVCYESFDIACAEFLSGR